MNAHLVRERFLFSRKMLGSVYMVLKGGQGICMGHWTVFRRSGEHGDWVTLPRWDFTSFLRLWPMVVKSLMGVWGTTEGIRKCWREHWGTEAPWMGFSTFHWYVLECQSHQSCRSLTGSRGRNDKGSRGWSLGSSRPLCRWLLLKWLPLGGNHCRPVN